MCELNQLELEFLFLCNFDLHVKLEEIQAYGDQLLTHAHIVRQQCALESSPATIPIISRKSHKIMKKSENLLHKKLKINIHIKEYALLD